MVTSTQEQHLMNLKRKPMDSIFQNVKYWKNFDDKELNKYSEKIFKHYRKNGFPFVESNSDYRTKEFNTLIKYNTDALIQDRLIKSTMHGLSLAWSYMPHHWDVECNNMKTPMSVFKDDTLFKKVILKKLSTVVFQWFFICTSGGDVVVDLISSCWCLWFQSLYLMLLVLQLWSSLGFCRQCR